MKGPPVWHRPLQAGSSFRGLRPGRRHALLGRALRRALAGFLVFIWGQVPVYAVDRIVLEGGGGHEGDLVRVGVQWDHHRDLWQRGRWQLGATLEVEVGAWRPEMGSRGLYEIGVTPVFRLAPEGPRSGHPTPFFEAGLGIHLLSRVRFSGLDLSTSLQFGSHIGAGVFFGRERRLSLVYRFQHLSNASIKQPNPGIEFHLLQLGYRFSSSG